MGSKQILSLVEGTADGAFAVDATGSITAWNKAASELFGWDASEAIGRRCHEVLHGSDEVGLVCPERCGLHQAITDNRPVANVDLQFETRMGKKWCNVSCLIANISPDGSRSAIHIARPQELHKRLEQAATEFVMAQRQVGHATESINSSGRWAALSQALTSREMAILNQLAAGQSTSSIADEFHISPATVRNHIKNVLRKLGAHTRLEAIRHAESAGLLFNPQVFRSYR
jgi:DNA-binding CsgD family transcriptional regulator